MLNEAIEDRLCYGRKVAMDLIKNDNNFRKRGTKCFLETIAFQIKVC